MEDNSIVTNLKVLLDITGLFFKILAFKGLTGVERVILAYLKYFHKLECILFVNTGILKFYIKPLATSKVLQHVLNYNAHKSRANWLRFILSILVNVRIKLNVNNYLFLSVGSQAKIVSRKFLSKYNLTSAFMVHDLLPIELPECSNVGFSKIFRKNINAILMNANLVILNSKDTQTKLISYSILNNLNLPKNIVALLGSGGEGRITTESIHNNGNYFVVVGSIVPRKNHIMLLNIWRRFAQQSINDLPRLIIIGGRGWRCNNVTDVLDDCPSIKNHVVELNSCNDLELQAYLQGAQALLFPSFAEGYGLPLVEALQLGTPVIVSDISVFREIAGDIPEYIDPLDTISWMNMILEYAKPNNKKRAKQLERMQGYAAPTWEEHFKIIEEGITLLRGKISSNVLSNI